MKTTAPQGSATVPPANPWEHNPTPQGASAYGTHYLKSWDSCRRKWWLSKRAPHPDGEGLRPRFTGTPLLIGSGFHDGIEAYYRSGTKGKSDYSKAAALAAAEDTMKARRGEWPDRTSYSEGLGEVLGLLSRYHEWWGPSGPQDDSSILQVVWDDDGPVVEREYSIPIAPGLPNFTCRVDALVRYRDWLYVLEHKTTTGRGVTALRNRMDLDSQATAECLVLQHHFPDEPIHGVLLNMVLKGHSTRSKFAPFLRDQFARTAYQMEQLKRDIANKFTEIQRVNSNYDWLVNSDGLSPWDAAAQVFHLTGTSNGHCFAYNRQCEYAELCKSVGLGTEAALLSGFKAAIPTPPPTQE